MNNEEMIKKIKELEDRINILEEKEKNGTSVSITYIPESSTGKEVH